MLFLSLSLPSVKIRVFIIALVSWSNTSRYCAEYQALAWSGSVPAGLAGRLCCDKGLCWQGPGIPTTVSPA